MLRYLALFLLVTTCVVSQDVKIFPRDEAILREQGESVELTCKVIPKFIFKRVTLATRSMVWIGPDGTEVKNGERIDVQQVHRHALRVTITDLRPEDTGLYQCRVKMSSRMDSLKTMEVVQGVSVLIPDSADSNPGVFDEISPRNETTVAPDNDTMILNHDFDMSLFNDSTGNTTAPPTGNTTDPPTGNTTVPPNGYTTVPPNGNTTVPPNGNTTVPPTGNTTVPPENDTMILNHDFYMSLFNDSTVPPDNDTMVQEFYMSLFNDTTVPPDNDTMVHDFYISLLNDSTVPPDNDTMVQEFYISLSNDSTGNTTVQPDNDTMIMGPDFYAANTTVPPENETDAQPPLNPMPPVSDDVMGDCSDISGTWYDEEDGRLLLRQSRVDHMTGLWKAGTVRNDWMILRGRRPTRGSTGFKLMGTSKGGLRLTTFWGDCEAEGGEETLQVSILTFTKPGDTKERAHHSGIIKRRFHRNMK